MTSELITPTEFYEAFIEAAAEHGETIFDASGIGNATFTDTMCVTVFSRAASSLNCFFFREYHKFACCFYREKSKHFPASATYLKSIDVALEHENEPLKAVNQIHKLQLLNAPLKVLVTYPRATEQVDELLAKYAEIVAECDVFGDTSTLRRQLVIFGFVEGRGFTWRGFVYDGGRFTELCAAELTAGATVAGG